LYENNIISYLWLSFSCLHLIFPWKLFKVKIVSFAISNCKCLSVTLSDLYLKISKWNFNNALLMSIYLIQRTGRPMWNMTGKRRRMAASRSVGLFVAPMIMIWHWGSVSSPSQKLMNCVFIMAVLSWSRALRDRKKESVKKVRFFEKKSETKFSQILTKEHHINTVFGICSTKQCQSC